MRTAWLLPLFKTHTLEVCPTDIVHAPARAVWDLIATPRELAGWSKTKIIEAPDRELRAGDRLVLGTGIGRRMRVVFEVERTLRPRQLALTIRLPLGVTNNEVIDVAPIAEDACRVTLN
jgi:hypothetical protein